jgi:hypothetical protein
LGAYTEGNTELAKAIEETMVNNGLSFAPVGELEQAGLARRKAEEARSAADANRSKYLSLAKQQEALAESAPNEAMGHVYHRKAQQYLRLAAGPDSVDQTPLGNWLSGLFSSKGGAQQPQAARPNITTGGSFGAAPLPPSVQARVDAQKRAEAEQTQAIAAAEQKHGSPIITDLRRAAESGDEDEMNRVAQRAIDALKAQGGLMAVRPYVPPSRQRLTRNDIDHLIADLMK